MRSYFRLLILGREGTPSICEIMFEDAFTHFHKHKGYS